jgi:hypothetical protein
MSCFIFSPFVSIEPADEKVLQLFETAELGATVLVSVEPAMEKVLQLDIVNLVHNDWVGFNWASGRERH